MFAHTFKAVVSFLLLATTVTAAPVDLGGLEARQGSCLSGLARPLPTNNIGRVSIQEYLGNADTVTFFLNNLVTVHVETTTTARSNTIDVSNSGSSSNTVLISNYADTNTGTPREQIRVDIPGRTFSGGAVNMGHVRRCVNLPRIDGFWYVELER